MALVTVNGEPLDEELDQLLLAEILEFYVMKVRINHDY